MIKWRKINENDKSILNGWHMSLKNSSVGEDAISKYVTSKDCLLGDVMCEIAGEKSSNNKRTNCYVAVKDNSAVGVVLASSKENVADIEAIVVNPKLAGKGVGTKMITSINDKSLKLFGKGVDTITAKVEAGNVASEKAFEKSGYISSSVKGVGSKKYNQFTKKLEHVKDVD